MSRVTSPPLVTANCTKGVLARIERIAEQREGLHLKNAFGWLGFGRGTAFFVQGGGALLDHSYLSDYFVCVWGGRGPLLCNFFNFKYVSKDLTGPPYNVSLHGNLQFHYVLTNSGFTVLGNFWTTWGWNISKGRVRLPKQMNFQKSSKSSNRPQIDPCQPSMN